MCLHDIKLTRPFNVDVGNHNNRLNEVKDMPSNNDCDVAYTQIIENDNITTIINFHVATHPDVLQSDILCIGEGCVGILGTQFN